MSCGMNVVGYKTFGKREAAYYSTQQHAKGTVTQPPALPNQSPTPNTFPPSAF